LSFAAVFTNWQALPPIREPDVGDRKKSRIRSHSMRIATVLCLRPAKVKSRMKISRRTGGDARRANSVARAAGGVSGKWIGPFCS